MCMNLLGQYIGGLVQDCSNSTANALELLQYFASPSICHSDKFLCSQWLYSWQYDNVWLSVKMSTIFPRLKAW